jgi:hypothetical protein
MSAFDEELYRETDKQWRERETNVTERRQHPDSSLESESEADSERGSGPNSSVDSEPDADSETAGQPTRPPLVALLESLDIGQNATRGAIGGIVIAAGAYLFRFLEVWGPLADGRQYPVVGPEGWFLLLAFVLAATSALLITVGLTVRAAVRETRAR